MNHAGARKLFMTTLAAAAACLPLACEDDSCDTEGCEAIERRQGSTSIAQGLVGAVAVLDDKVIMDCQKCPFGTGVVRIWRVESPVTSVETARATAATAPLHDLWAETRYALELAPADYLFCASFSKAVDSSCVTFTVAAHKVTTINVQLGVGWPRLVVFDPGAAGSREQVFVVPPN